MEPDHKKYLTENHRREFAENNEYSVCDRRNSLSRDLELEEYVDVKDRDLALRHLATIKSALDQFKITIADGNI